MANVEIYSTPYCPYCHRAKALLKAKNVTFSEVDVFMTPSRKKEMIQRAGGRTSVPQIFIDGRHIGGCDELHALDAQGGLDPLLAA